MGHNNQPGTSGLHRRKVKGQHSSVPFPFIDMCMCVYVFYEIVIIAVIISSPAFYFKHLFRHVRQHKKSLLYYRRFTLVVQFVLVGATKLEELLLF